MATNHLARDHYSNAIMLNRDGKPMTTISDEKVEWYTSRGLAHLVEYPGYTKAIQLTFEHKGKDSRDEADLIKMTNQCVVCGNTETLSLHHCVPYSVKRHYPIEYKEHTRRQCVLLCEAHHLAIEELNRKILPNPYAPIEGHLTWLNKMLGLYTRWLKKWMVRYWRWRKGGVKVINQEYIDLFMTMEPQYLPKDWLKP